MSGFRGWMLAPLAVGCTPLQQAQVADETTTVAADTGDTGGDGSAPTQGNNPADSPDDGPDDGLPDGDADAGTDDGQGGLCQNDADCDDGTYCNGKELCDPDNADASDKGCVRGDVPCQREEETCSEEFEICVGPCGKEPDLDGDGENSVACGGTDCNDEDDEINSAAEEICDDRDVDNDCDPETTNEDFIGSDAHCTACNDPCSPGDVCLANECVRPRRVFLSSATFDGNFGGVENADGECQDLADDAALGGSWLAYIIQQDNGLARHDQTGGPFILLDETPIADDWSDLSDGTLAAPINLTEMETTVSANVWTGLAPSATVDPDVFCDAWTSNSDGCSSMPGDICGAAGESMATGAAWDGADLHPCNSLFHLYCVEQ